MNAKTKTNKAENTNTADNDKLTGFEAALLAAVAAGAIKADDVNAVIIKAGFDTAEAEHADARPINKAEAAKAALLAFGVNIDEVKAEAGNLAVSVDGIAKAVGKYGKHCFAADMANGTSIVTHSITRQLVENGKATLTKTLEDARKALPAYSSTGHFNTMKRLLKEHYSLNVWQGGFAISAKK